MGQGQLPGSSPNTASSAETAHRQEFLGKWLVFLKVTDFSTVEGLRRLNRLVGQQLLLCKCVAKEPTKFKL